MSPNTQILILATVAFGAFMAFSWRRNHRLKQLIAQQTAAAQEKQEFVLSRLDAIGKLLETSNISAAELQRRSDEIISEMQSRNADGGLDASISDVKGSIFAEVRKRQGA